MERGEIHALLGQNGAGKTTLGRILAGLTRPDAGSVSIAGRHVQLRSAAEARALGIAMVHQHFSLVPRFTGLDNVRLFNDGAWTGHGLPTTAYRDRVEARAGELGLSVILDEPVERLGVGDRQRLEVLKALMSDTRVLILDEPTAVLTPGEVSSLFRVLRSVAEHGTSICLIAHNLDEVLSVADRITVLRDGRWTLTEAASSLSASDLAEAMIGETLTGEPLTGPTKETNPDSDRPGPAPESAPGRPSIPVASLEGVTLGGLNGLLLTDVSLDVRRGEIVGVAGVEGNGQRELAAVLAGLTAPDTGTATVPERVGWIPQDRTTEGLIQTFSLTENMALALHSHPSYQSGGFLNWPRMSDKTRRIVEDQEVRAEGPAASTAGLSGGNQQKLLTARELERSRDLLVAESPTRGLDVKAAAAVKGRILALVHEGEPPGVVLISSDLDEVLALADRIFVMVRGRLIPVPDDARSRKHVGGMMLGAAVT